MCHREGAKHSELVFVSSGNLKVCHKDKRGKEVIFSLLIAGDFFGEIALLTGSDRSADVVALAASSVLALDKEDFDAHIAKYTGLTNLMLVAMANRVRIASQRIKDLALYDVSCRVARALWSIGEFGEKDGKKFSVLYGIPTHKTLAGIVGCSREVVSRAIKALEDEGHLIFTEDGVKIVSLP